MSNKSAYYRMDNLFRVIEDIENNAFYAIIDEVYDYCIANNVDIHDGLIAKLTEMKDEHDSNRGLFIEKHGESKFIKLAKSIIM